MIALFGAVLVQLLGTGAIWLARRERQWSALTSPSSFFVGLALLYAVALGPLGLGIALLVALGLRGASPVPFSAAHPAGRFALIAVLLFVLARPWLPVAWDEFVWLGKARLGSLGFDAGIRAALDVGQGLIPAGYPPLWPAAVGWLSVGVDRLETHVLAASLLVLLSAAVAWESWRTRLGDLPAWAPVAVLLAAPLVWVHLRLVYVDLPLGLLSLALLGELTRDEAKPGLAAIALAVVLAGFKDEGVGLVLSCSVAAGMTASRRNASLWLPLAAAAWAFGAWRWLLHTHDVVVVDHSLGTPVWSWGPSFARLLVLHATELKTWGVFWSLAAVAMLLRNLERAPRALRVMLLLQLGITAAALLCGPERVRVFAENGTLLNRWLLQLWPGAAVLILLALPLRPASTPISSRAA